MLMSLLKSQNRIGKQSTTADILAPRCGPCTYEREKRFTSLECIQARTTMIMNILDIGIGREMAFCTVPCYR